MEIGFSLLDFDGLNFFHLCGRTNARQSVIPVKEFLQVRIVVDEKTVVKSIKEISLNCPERFEEVKGHERMRSSNLEVSGNYLDVFEGLLQLGDNVICQCINVFCWLINR